jgi:hypothetical protein
MTISVVLKGRLGNQLFQYATLKSVALKNNYNININTDFEWHGQKCLLDNFKLSSSALEDNFCYTSKYVQPHHSSTFDDNVFTIKDNTLLEGHFENPKFFEDYDGIIQDELTVKDNNISSKEASEFINNIRVNNNNCSIVGIHIRRGDNYSQNVFNEFEIVEFIKKCLDIINSTNSNIYCILFTGGSRDPNGNPNWVHNTLEDDIEWLNNYIKTFPYKNIISPGTMNNSELYDYCLLSMCDYNILPLLSTFSWMASYVNKINCNQVFVNKNCMLLPAKKFIVV